MITIRQGILMTEDAKKSDDSIKIPKSTLKWLGVVCIAFIAGIAFGTITATAGISGYAGAQPSPQPEERAVIALLADDHILGDANAPVTIVEFSDYQCPYCQRFRQQTFDQIKTNYIDTGKAKFVYKNYPLTAIGHVSADKAAETAECAGEQGKYWEMHDILFAKQQTDWGYYEQDKGKYLPVAQAIPFFKQYAQELGLDTVKFNACLDGDKYASKISKDFSDGNSAAQQAGVPGLGTPSFFINGKLVSGAQPFVAFQSVIDAELNA